MEARPAPPRRAVDDESGEGEEEEREGRDARAVVEPEEGVVQQVVVAEDAPW